MVLHKIRFTFFVLAFTSVLSLKAEYPLNYESLFTVGSGSGDFAPYYQSSLRHGRFTQADNAQIEAKLWRPVDIDKRFSYGFGVDIIGGYASAVDYEKYNPVDMKWGSHSERPSSVWIQQLYGDIKYRSVFISVGMKEHGSAILDQSLTSGDLVESGNTRPIPEVRAGFIDFQDIPFTKGWIQIQGEIGYGRMIDDGWWKDHFNYYNGTIRRDLLYNYKRCYFRTEPSRPLSVTFGMQAAAVFGGTTDFYFKGELAKSQKNISGIKGFFKMLIPINDGEEGFYAGNHVGSWDIKARYRLKNGSEISAYASWLWEDGSGIGKLNGWDGLCGIGYRSSKACLISGALVEFLEFTNQSGPIHFAPGDFPGTTIPDHVSGADDYYNNAIYGSWSYFGQSLGSPAMMAPVYNRDGYPHYIGNVMRGFHIGIEGYITPRIDYRLKGGYRKAWGTSKMMLPRPLDLTAVMMEASWRPVRIDGLSINASLELNRGSMPENSFGAMVGLRYTGLLNL